MCILSIKCDKMRQKESPGKAGRPKKPTSVNQRTTNVYFPTIEMKEEWKAVARANNQSISKFIIERVEESLRLNGEGPRYTRKDLIDRNTQLEKENEMLRKDLEIKDLAYKVLDQELKVLRSQPFLTPIEAGHRQLSQEFINLLRERKRIKYDELLPLLHIKPTDQNLVKTINQQIELLTHFGLIKSDLKGWKWIE